MIFTLLVLASGGCSRSPNEAGDPSAKPSLSPQVSPSREPLGTYTPGFPHQGGTTQLPATMPSPLTPDLQDLIEEAKKDLAQRLTTLLTQIRFIELDEVVWPDSSLGCPQEGMAYAQVLTPGYLIRLEYGSKQYEYHGAKRGDVFFCADPTAPVPGVPDTF